MSSIVQLTIQGIRSFGIKAEDKQSIAFSSPLTLILGANGCGKTTIIECLKYALTGELPPGSDRGKGFVHDPKIFDSVEVLGQVKLKVKNIRGQYLTVTRSVKICPKRGKAAPSFEALDATITFGENENESISKRGADVENELIHFMGVSKAIMNNVIFCHQENASWPLDEPKKLKEKFDAIFGTTKYDKVIEKMIKLKKDQIELLRRKKDDLKYALERKKDTDSKSLDLENIKKKKEDLTIQCTAINQDLKPIEDRLTSIQRVELEISKFHTEKMQLQLEIKHCNDQIKSLKSTIKKEFEGTAPQLDREIRNFYEKMNEKKSELQNLEDLFQSMKIKEQKIQNTVTEMDRKRTTLTHQRQQEQEFQSDRANKMIELCENFQIIVNSDLETAKEADILVVLKKIEMAFQLEDKKISNLSESHDKIDHEKQIEIDKCRESKVTIESDIQSKQIQYSKQEKELKKIEEEIKMTESNAKKLTAITEQVEKVEQVIKSFEEKINFAEKKNIIDNIKVGIRNKQEEYRKIDARLTLLNSISKQMAELQLKEKEFERREQEIKKIKNKHGDTMKIIFPNEQIESNYKRKFQNAYDNIQKKIKDLQEKEYFCRLESTSLEAERKNKKDELTKWEKELEENSEKIFDKCRGSSYEEILARSKENVEKYQLELGALRSAESMFKKYIKNIEEDPCCPLCHKTLSTNEASDINLEMNDEIRKVPANIKKTELLLSKEHRNFESLMSLKSIIERNKILEIDIPKRKENLKKIKDKLIESTNMVESHQMLIAEPTSNLDLVNSMLGDMALLDEALKDFVRIEIDLKKLKEKLPVGEDISNIENVQLEKTTISAELESMRNDFDKKESDYQTEMDRFTKLRENRTTLKDRQIKLQEGVQSLPQLKLRCNEISNNIILLSTEIEKLQDSLKPIKLKLQNLIKEKENIKNKSRSDLNEANKKLNNLKKINHDIERYNKELKTLADEHLVEEIEKLKINFTRVLTEQVENNKEISETLLKIENLKNDISKQELLERDLKDNRDLKNVQQKQNRLQEKADDLNKEIGDLNFSSISKERNSLIEKRDSITSNRGQIRGQISEIEIQIKKLEMELEDPKYKDSLKHYRKLYYEAEILKQIIHDLGEYQIALDNALNKFHSEKMQKINRLIREFWRQIYRGNDIDYIEIKTESDGAKTASEKRRVFNYSVVQSKNNSKIEMRGRCSAGQRVLASLIIRMALAETFSANCGVLALDEPTTNLDRNNIMSLCDTLNQIVEERRTQCNFMLIVITHDEEFISNLAKIQNYHKVSRTSEGKSIIRKHKTSV